MKLLLEATFSKMNPALHLIAPFAMHLNVSVTISGQAPARGGRWK